MKCCILLLLDLIPESSCWPITRSPMSGRMETECASSGCLSMLLRNCVVHLSISSSTLGSNSSDSGKRMNSFLITTVPSPVRHSDSMYDSTLEWNPPFLSFSPTMSLMRLTKRFAIPLERFVRLFRIILLSSKR